MKNKFLVLLIGLTFIVNIYAKESRIGIKVYDLENEIKCNDKSMHVVNYNYDTNELIVSENYSDNSNEYYIINEKNECNKITNNDWLNLYNSYQTYYSTMQTDYNEDLQDSSFVIIEYKKMVGLTYGYIPNTEKYNRTKEYYEIIDNEIKSVTNPTRENNENYYLKVNLKNVSSETLDKNKTYYTLDTETGLYKVKDDENINILDIYEVTDEKIETIKNYSKSESAAARTLNKYKDSDNEQIIINIILDELFYGIFYYDDEGNLVKTKYYGDYYNVIKEFENKIFYNYEDYVIASDINYKNYYIYDKKFNLINTIKLNKKCNLESIYDANGKIYFTLTDENGNHKSYMVSSKLSKGFVVLVIFDIIFISLIVYLIIKIKKCKNKIDIYEKERLEESLLMAKRTKKKKRNKLKKRKVNDNI